MLSDFLIPSALSDNSFIYLLDRLYVIIAKKANRILSLASYSLVFIVSSTSYLKMEKLNNTVEKLYALGCAAYVKEDKWQLT